MRIKFGIATAILLVTLAARHTPAAEKPDPDSARIEKGGAELWTHNCRRCHNLRAPTSYSSDQWEVVVNHMRIRAGLTAKDARKIEEFLKAAD